MFWVVAVKTSLLCEFLEISSTKTPSKKNSFFAKILREKKVFEVTKDETFGLPSDYLVGYRRLVELVSFLFSSSYGFE